MPLCGNLYLSGFNSQRQTLLRPDLQAELDRIFDVLKGLLLSLALTHASRNRCALDYPNTVFVSVDGYVEYHIGASLVSIACCPRFDHALLTRCLSKSSGHLLIAD